ncbi:MAG TPA: nitrilase-related carbon-nitrogen hydrolase [Candidatus Eisenbacteria bacterium]
MLIRHSAGSLPRGPASWVWLAVAACFMLFSGGRWSVPAAAWLAPVFMVRFVRAQSAATGIVAGAVAAIGVTLVSWSGLIPVPAPIYLAVAGLFGLGFFLPYALDRLIAPRLPGFESTLVLPLAWTTVEWLNASFNPYGTWGSVAYTQADNLPLLQLLAVTGLWGVTFLIAWFAAVVNWAWRRRFEWKRVRPGVLLYAAVASLALMYGGLRLALSPPRAPTVRIAALTVRPGPAMSIMRLLRPDFTRADLDEALRRTHALHDTLFARTQREARAGARLVLWSEVNGLVVKQDEAGLIERGRALARREGIWLLMPLATATPGNPKYENQLVAVRPDGSVAFRYHKARPVPGDPETGADRRIPAPVESAFGRISGAICFDLDFPPLMRRAGRERADILFAPSSDWQAIDPIHTRMAICRGVENGCSVVRQTHQGLSAAADHQGRVLAAVDFFRAADPVMVAQVPTRGVRTIYARFGDVFAWFGLAGLIVLAAAALSQPARF